MRPQVFCAYPLTEMREMRGGNLSTAIATFGGRYARATLILFMTLYALRIISVHKTLNFVYFLQKRDIPTDRRTDGPTDRRTDGRTHPLIEMRGRI